MDEEGLGSYPEFEMELDAALLALGESALILSCASNSGGVALKGRVFALGDFPLESMVGRMEATVTSREGLAHTNPRHWLV